MAKVTGKRKIRITLLVDDASSWICPYVADLCKKLKGYGEVHFVHKGAQVKKGDILFILGCQKILSQSILRRNCHNIVIHESNLPRGRGHSPMIWQVLAGDKKIPIVAFEAVETLDAGPIYFKGYIQTRGHELLPELRYLQWIETEKLIRKVIGKYPNLKGHKQKGKATRYPKRNPMHNRLNINASLKKLFDDLRVCSNEQFPAWFEYKGRRYRLKIYEEKADK